MIKYIHIYQLIMKCLNSYKKCIIFHIFFKFESFQGSILSLSKLFCKGNEWQTCYILFFDNLSIISAFLVLMLWFYFLIFINLVSWLNKNKMYLRISVLKQFLIQIRLYFLFIAFIIFNC